MLQGTGPGTPWKPTHVHTWHTTRFSVKNLSADSARACWRVPAPDSRQDRKTPHCGTLCWPRTRNIHYLNNNASLSYTHVKRHRRCLPLTTESKTRWRQTNRCTARWTASMSSWQQWQRSSSKMVATLHHTKATSSTPTRSMPRRTQRTFVAADEQRQTQVLVLHQLRQAMVRRAHLAAPGAAALRLARLQRLPTDKRCKL